MSTYRLFRRLVSCALAIGVVSLPGQTLGSAPTATHDARLPTPVIIGEVAWAGSSLSIADEWIELWNLGDAPVSLAGWSLRGAGENGAMIPFATTGTIPAHGVYLISNYASSDAKSAIATSIVIDVVTTTVSLSNSALKIELLDAAGAVVDTAGAGGVPLAGASLPTKQTMIRMTPRADGSLAIAWMSATSSQNFKPGVSDLGTPGVCDGCRSVTPLPAITTASSSPLPTIVFATTTIVTVTSSTFVLISPTTTRPELARAPSSTPMTLGSVSSSSALALTASSTILVPISTATAAIISTSSTQTRTSSLSSSASSSASAATVSSTASTPTSSTTIATTTAATPSTTTVSLSGTSSPTPSSLPTPPRPNYGMLRLNEVAPAPLSGKEWIEVVTLDASQPISLHSCQLMDSRGRIFTFGSQTIDPATSRYLAISLSTSRLNNSGDSVALYDPNGRLLDVMHYNATPRGSSWIRFPDLNGDWQLTTAPTPGDANVLIHQTETAQGTEVAEVAKVAQEAEMAQMAEVATVTGTRELAVLNADEARDTNMQDREEEAAELENLRIMFAEDQRVVREAQNVKPRAAAIQQKIATSSQKKTIPITFDMLTHTELGGRRVRLMGRVGSPPGLLPRHSFILLASDGRGLAVSVSSRQRLPALGSDVSVTGSLLFDDRSVPFLRMTTHDAWVPRSTSTHALVPRVVDLLTPGAEDAWSLMQVTGTVMRLAGANVTLDLDDAEVTVVVKPVVKYRAKRLASGDIISVTGVLDTTHDAARILPRTADEIVILKHAEKSATSDSRFSTSIPSWAPIGAAGGAVIATEGVKYWHRRRKTKKLEKRAKAGMPEG